MLKKLLVGLGLVIAGIFGYAAVQPDTFQISRAATMSAPVEVVFDHVNDLRKMDAWSPWLKPDPEAKTTYGGAPAGVGASFAWEGNRDVGSGKMTIVESKPNELVRLNLEFYKPMESTATTDFTFKVENGQTIVTQTMNGKNNVFSRVLCLFMDMDKMIGGQFDAGFATLKTLVEAQAVSQNQ